jgi:hypothetical protein
VERHCDDRATASTRYLKYSQFCRSICNSDGQENGGGGEKKNERKCNLCETENRPLSHTNNAYTGTKRLIFCSSQGMLLSFGAESFVFQFAI